MYKINKHDVSAIGTGKTMMVVIKKYIKSERRKNQKPNTRCVSRAPSSMYIIIVQYRTDAKKTPQTHPNKIGRAHV